MVKIAKGVSIAAVRFVILGVAVPYLIDMFQTQITRYLTLPPSGERWIIFGAFGAGFALTGFLQAAYLKGDYPWLLGKLAAGAVGFAFYSYIFLIIARPANLPTSQSYQLGGLLVLIYATIGLSYAYLFLDFFDVRRSRAAAKPSSLQVPAK